MPIPVEHEDTEALKAWGLGLERTQEDCTLCGTPTRLWYRKRHPVCQSCSESCEESQLPSLQAPAVTA